VYQDFVESFQGDEKAKTFVRGGVINPDAKPGTPAATPFKDSGTPGWYPVPLGTPRLTASLC